MASASAISNPSRSRIGLWVTLGAALVYCAWLGAHWLPLDYSDKELAGFVSRVWDVQRELVQHHHLPWWTPYYLSGSSYGLNHSQGLYLLPCLLLASFFPLLAAAKLTALAAIFAGAVAMYYCARYFLKNEWAAALAALVFLLHPEQLIRAAGAEHLGVILFFPFMPLSLLFWARALETGRYRDIFWCAVSLVGLLWSHNKMAFVQGVFLAGYLGYWLWPRRRQWLAVARTVAVVAGLSLALGAPLVLPGVIESRYVKLLAGEREQLIGWQHGYAFKSLLPLVDRDGVATHAAVQGVQAALQQQRYRPTSREEVDRLRTQIGRVFSLTADAPEKYAGLVVVVVLAVTALFNTRRVNRGLFWFFVAMLLLSVMFSFGLSTVWGANWATALALFGLDGVPGATRLAVLLPVAVTVAFLVLFARRKLTSPRKWVVAGAALAAFLWLPAFDLLAAVPFFKEIRAPFVFYDGPGTFFVAMLAGFFVTDALAADRWSAHRPKIVAAVGVLLLLDYWPYQEPTMDNGVPARTLANLRASYSNLRADPGWSKTYSFSGRYFHLLGPMLGGKPQVYEAFYNWMAPLGTGLLNQHAWGSLEAHRAFLDLMAAGYVVFDKTDRDNAGSGPQQILAAYRQLYPDPVENEDFAVFRNPTAHSYLTGYGRACLFVGDVRDSPSLALALAGRGLPLVHADTASSELPADRLRQFERIYVTAGAQRDWQRLSPDVQARVSFVAEGTPPVLPAGGGAAVALADVQLVRERNDVVRATLTAPAACWTVVAESWYPFWRATVDGQRVELRRISTALMGFELTAGRHAVVLEYCPPRAYGVAMVISAVALLGCAVWGWWSTRRLKSGQSAGRAERPRPERSP